MDASLGEINPNLKFENCAFRSDEEIEKSIKTCRCRPATDLKGYECSKLGIYPLDRRLCVICQEFQQKEE